MDHFADPKTGELRVVAPGLLAFLDRVELEGEQLKFGGHWFLVRASSRMLSEFRELGRPTASPGQFVRYARRWGPLGNRTSFTVGPDGWPLGGDPVSWDGRERLASWRLWASLAVLILDLAGLALEDNRSGLAAVLSRLPEDSPLLPASHRPWAVSIANSAPGPGWLATYLLNAWLAHAGGLRLEMEWPLGAPRPELFIDYPARHLGALGHQLALTMIGARGLATCETCARLYRIQRPSRASDGHKICARCRDAARKRRKLASLR